VAISLLAILFSGIDWPVLKKAVMSARISLLLLSALLFYPGLAISVLRWKLFFSALDLPGDFRLLCRVYFQSSFLNNFMPGSIGGDVYKISKFLHLGRPGDVLASIVADRGSGLLSVLALQILLIPFFYSGRKEYNLLIVLIFLAVLSAWRWHPAIVSLLSRARIGFLARLARLIESFSRVMNGKLWLKASAYSFLFLSNIALGRYLSFSAFDYHLDFGFLLFAVTFVQAISFLPISINSIGLAEGASVFIYSLAGVPAEVSLSVALVGRLAMTLNSAIGGIFFLLPDHSKSKSIDFESGDS
jgi:uncharacterized protein (TIRG00374 family)